MAITFKRLIHYETPQELLEHPDKVFNEYV